MKKYTLKSSDQPVNLTIDYRQELNDEQYGVVTQADGPCLVLAGAGSGKTRTLVYRLLYLLEHGVKPDRILLVTFTNKAAKEMLNRTEVLYKQKPQGLWGGTFHSIGNRVLRQYGRHIGIESNFNILDAEDSKALTKSCFNQARVPQDKHFPKADFIHKIISFSANVAQPIEQVIADRFAQIDDSYVPIIVDIAKAYTDKKRQSNALDYDDLLLQWHRLLMEKPEVREQLAKKFQYILVDEYQDTNYLQGEIIRHLAGEDENILVVGDDSQSIYSFRGADVNNILSFPKDFPQAQTFRLETNYRSTPEILALANFSILNNRKQFKKTLQTNKPSGAKPALVALDDNYQQAQFIGQRILDLQEEEGVGLGQMAVLFRAHYQSLELEMELNKRNIPYVMRGGLRFFEQSHIKDMVAYLKIINNFRDELSWQRIARLQPGVGGANAGRMWQSVAGLTSPAELNGVLSPLSGKAYVAWEKIKSIIIHLSQTDKNKVARLIDIVSRTGYYDYLKNNFENYQDRIDDINQLIVFAESYDLLDKFLADVALSEGFKGGSATEDNQGGDEEALTLTTIHQAKGLEWHSVFVIGLSDGQFPNLRVFDRPADMEEERRLFYVATTRAENQLYLTYSLLSKATGNINQLSQFVKELPAQAYEEWRVKEESVGSRFIGGSGSRRHNDESDEPDTIFLDDSGEQIDGSSVDDEAGDIAKEFWQRFASRRQ